MRFDFALVCLLSTIFSLTVIGRCTNAGEISDEELASRQATIGHIVIVVDDVFEGPEARAGLYWLTNTLHINSRVQTIEAQLLFRTGDPFDRRVFDETERLLRGQRYLNAATIVATTYNEADNTVDLLVRVHDVWTLSPGVSFSRQGGWNSTRVELEENNLLGFGKRIEFWRSQDIDRTSLRVSYQDPNLLGSWWRLSTAYASSSDGSEKTFGLARPFYSLDTRWSANAIASDVTSGVARYRLGEPIEPFTLRRQLLDLGGGISDGLENGWVRRYLAGMRYESREFLQPLAQASTLPADRIVSYPWLGIEVLEDNFVKTHNFNQIRRTEDVHLGLAARLEAGYAAPALGSTRGAAIVNGSLSLGRAFDDRQTLLGAVALGSRVEGGAIRNGHLNVSSRYYLRHNAYSSFFASVAAILTEKLDAENQIFLGGENGLRGYPLRYQSGKHQALVTLEERFYSGWQPLKLVDVGAAVFFDAGRVWGNDGYGGEPLGWLKNIGVGLRLGSARSGLGNILHIDVAVPLGGPRDISHVQLLIDTRRSF